MKYALMSDIHANLPALEAVLADIAAREVDATYHLGDLVGYAPWPNEVVARVSALGIPGVAGNYDSAVATYYKHCGCRYEDAAQEALSHLSYEWTLTNISHESRTFLGGLPFRVDIRPLGGHVAGPTVTLLHGSPALNTVYVTEDRTDGFLEKMAESIGARPGDVVCFGHTHLAWYRVVSGVRFVNTGSVGRPKDGDARAGYVVLEVKDTQVKAELVRVPYDVEVAARGIEASSLPKEFAAFLRAGGRADSSHTFGQ
jgi:predicted phosphodiesterase